MIRFSRLKTGVPLLSDSGFNLIADKADGTSEPVAVSGQPFTNATRLTALHPTSQPWNVQALIVTQEAITTGDSLTLSFWLRAAPGTEGGKVTVNFQTNGPEYKVLKSSESIPTAAWQKVEMEFHAPLDRAAGATMLVLQLGHQAQSIEVGGVSSKRSEVGM